MFIINIVVTCVINRAVIHDKLHMRWDSDEKTTDIQMVFDGSHVDNWHATWGASDSCGGRRYNRHR